MEGGDGGRDRYQEGVRVWVGGAPPFGTRGGGVRPPAHMSGGVHPPQGGPGGTSPSSGSSCSPASSPARTPWRWRPSTPTSCAAWTRWRCAGAGGSVLAGAPAMRRGTLPTPQGMPNHAALECLPRQATPPPNWGEARHSQWGRCSLTLIANREWVGLGADTRTRARGPSMGFGVGKFLGNALWRSDFWGFGTGLGWGSPPPGPKRRLLQCRRC